MPRGSCSSSGGGSPCPAGDTEAAHGEVGGVPKICWPNQNNPHLATPPSSSSNGLGRSNTPASVLQLLNQHRRNAKGLAMLFILETAAHRASPLSVIAPPKTYHFTSPEVCKVSFVLENTSPVSVNSMSALFHLTAEYCFTSSWLNHSRESITWLPPINKILRISQTKIGI